MKEEKNFEEMIEELDNIANKINTGTITFNEAQYILDYLGYKFTIEKK